MKTKLPHLISIVALLAGCGSTRLDTNVLKDQANKIVNSLPKEGMHYHYGEYMKSWVIIDVDKDKQVTNYDLFHKDYRKTAIRFTDKVPFGSLDEVTVCKVDYKPKIPVYACICVNLDENLRNETFKDLVQLTNRVLTKNTYQKEALIDSLNQKH